MKKLIRVLLAGLAISFLGSLPLGTMNIAAAQIAIQKGANAGLLYATGSMLTEIIIVRLSLVAMGWLVRQHRIFHFLELFTVLLLFILSAVSFVAAYKMSGFSKTGLISSLNPFWTGVFLSATNPLHIPFWMGWSTALINKQLLKPDPVYYNFYIAGIGTGTILGFMVFIYGGGYMVNQVKQHQTLLNLAIGVVLLGTAVLQLKKIITTPAQIRYGRNVNQIK